MIFALDSACFRYASRSKQAALISILHLCAESTRQQTLDKIQRFAPTSAVIEHILVYDSLRPNADLPNLPIESAVSILQYPGGREIPALSFNLALSAASGNWIWLWKPNTLFSSSDIHEVVETIKAASASHLIWLQPPGDVTRGSRVTINEIYNGLSPASDSLIWRADVFQHWGCFDPHLAVADAFSYEMLLRIIRQIRIAELSTRDGTPAVYIPERLQDALFYADSRKIYPTLDSLAQYAIDDLTLVEQKHGTAIAWRIYLAKILPYYYRHRHLLPPALCISPQSIPRKRLSALFTKVQYETSNELTFGNYERHFKGSRHFYFTYLQSPMLSALRHVLDHNRAGQIDVLVSTRTADDGNTKLVRKANATGLATAYLTDDDLLTFHEYGGGFASFRPGDIHYEAMTRAIQDADVVIGFSEQIERSTAEFNKRYIGCQDSVPLDFLPVDATKLARSSFYFGYAGSGYRTDEFALLRPAIQRILDEYGDRVKFSFWGISHKDVNVHGNAEYKLFSEHYLEYLERLRHAGFDAMLVPLMTEPTPKKAKNPNKFMETAGANAIGLYSDVPSYRVVRNGITGIKVGETAEAWYAAMKSVIEMSEPERTKIRANALAYVRTFFSTPALATMTETGIIAAQLHQQTRAKRLDDGRPLVAFFFPSVAGTGGGEIQLWRRLELARRLGLRVLVVISSLWASPQDAERVTQLLTAQGIEHEFVPYNAFFTTPYDLDIMPTPPELDALREFFARRANQIALAHSLAFVPAVGQTCTEFGIPHLASIYGIEDGYEFPNGSLPFKYCDLIQSDSIRYAKKWAGMLKCEWVCARETVPAEIYDIGFDKLYVNPTSLGRRIHASLLGTFTSRKSQHETILSLAFLPKEILGRIELHLYGGVDVYPEYGQACRQACREVEALGAQVEFHGHVTDIAQVYRQSDIVLSVSTLESFPSTIKEATSAGTLVIASKAGGIAEMMVDEVNCFLTENIEPATIAATIVHAINTSPETLLAIRRNAYALAVEEFHPRRTLHDLALCYNLCIDVAQPGSMPLHNNSPAIAPAERDYTSVALSGGLRYQVIPAYRNWIGLDVRIKQNDDVTGAVALHVFLRDGRLLRETVGKPSVQNPQWLEFRFNPISNAAQATFLLEFTPQNKSSPSAPAFCESNSANQRERDAVRHGLVCEMKYI